MRSMSGDRCLTNMYTSWSMSEPSLVNLGCMIMRNWPNHKSLTLLTSPPPEKQYLYLTFQWTQARQKSYKIWKFCTMNKYIYVIFLVLLEYFKRFHIIYMYLYFFFLVDMLKFLIKLGNLIRNSRPTTILCIIFK